MEKTLYTMEDCSEFTATVIEDSFLSKEEIEKRMNKLDKKISSLKTKTTKLEKKVKELEKRQWKFKVGDIVLYDGWRKVRITGLIDYDGYLYVAEPEDCYEAFGGIRIRPNEIQPFNPYTYERQLIDKVCELKVKNKMLGGKE